MNSTTNNSGTEPEDLVLKSGNLVAENFNFSRIFNSYDLHYDNDDY